MCHGFMMFVCCHALAVFVIFSIEGLVFMLSGVMHSPNVVVTLRFFPGLAGFPSPPSFMPRLLIPAFASFA